MATGLIPAAANGLLAGTVDLSTFVWIQLHTGDPGAAGTLSVATEADRMQATWGTPSGGSKTTTAQLEWTGVAGSEDYTHFSAWTASSAGTCGFTGAIIANAVTAGDTFRIAAGGLTVSFAVASNP